MKNSFHRIAARCLAATLGLACFLVGTAAMAQTSTDTVLGPGGRSSNSASTTANPPKITISTAASSLIGSGALTDRVVLHLGQPVDELTFRVSNHTNSTIKYDFNTGLQYDVVVSDSTGKEVWTYSRQRLSSPLMTHLILRPGESKMYPPVVWNHRDDSDKPVSAGTYTAAASLQSMPRIEVSRTATINNERDGRSNTNVGLPMSSNTISNVDSAQNGSVEQSNVAPPVQAKVTIEVVPAK